MSGNLANQSPFLRTSRTFPTESQPLSVEIDRSYLDIANAVNQRTIGLFPIARSAITGESWFTNNNQKQQTLRQVYTFTTAGNIAHGINFSNISAFTRIYGTFTDGTNWYPLPFVETNNVNNQVSIALTPTNIVITSGAGATPNPSGYVVLEWLSLS